jgi:hypothetical protein
MKQLTRPACVRHIVGSLQRTKAWHRPWLLGPFIEAALRYQQPLKLILNATRAQWDRAEMRPAVRENFEKVTLCRTSALGAEVYASVNEEKVVPHTCKSRSCPSCGHRGTLLWQREQWASLPDVPYVGINLTMPDVLYPSFE